VTPHSRLFAGLALSMALFLGGCDRGDGSGGGSSAPAGATDAPLDSIDLATLGHNEGSDDALIRIVEFSDYGCVFCAGFHLDSYPGLYDEFVAGGTVVWKYVPITIGGFPNGDEAAVTGECAAAQGRFAEMRDFLYAKRPEWFEGDAASIFRGYAAELGLDVAAFDACVASGEAATRIRQNNQVALQFGVRATPTFFIEDFPVEGAPSLENFQEGLRGLIAEVRGAGGGGND
jgi:protein-disulfide isomerase